QLSGPPPRDPQQKGADFSESALPGGSVAENKRSLPFAAVTVLGLPRMGFTALKSFANSSARDCKLLQRLPLGHSCVRCAPARALHVCCRRWYAACEERDGQ